MCSRMIHLLPKYETHVSTMCLWVCVFVCRHWNWTLEVKNHISIREWDKLKSYQSFRKKTKTKTNKNVTMAMPSHYAISVCKHREPIGGSLSALGSMHSKNFTLTFTCFNWMTNNCFYFCVSCRLFPCGLKQMNHQFVTYVTFSSKSKVNQR